MHGWYRPNRMGCSDFDGAFRCSADQSMAASNLTIMVTQEDVAHWKRQLKGIDETLRDYFFGSLRYSNYIEPREGEMLRRTRANVVESLKKYDSSE